MRVHPGRLQRGEGSCVADTGLFHTQYMALWGVTRRVTPGTLCGTALPLRDALLEGDRIL